MPCSQIAPAVPAAGRRGGSPNGGSDPAGPVPPAASRAAPARSKAAPMSSAIFPAILMVITRRRRPAMKVGSADFHACHQIASPHSP